MKIAIPVWEGKVSPVFDTASRLLVFDVEDAREIKRFQTSLDEKDLGRRCSRIKGLGIELLICGAISSQFRDMLMASGVKVISWISGQTEEVVKAYLNGKLCDPKFLMPGHGEEHMKEMAKICDRRK